MRTIHVATCLRLLLLFLLLLHLFILGGGLHVNLLRASPGRPFVPFQRLRDLIVVRVHEPELHAVLHRACQRIGPASSHAHAPTGFPHEPRF